MENKRSFLLETKYNENGQWIFKNICNFKGQLVFFTGWDGMSSTYTYDKDDRLECATHTCGGDEKYFGKTSYTYDDINNIVTEMFWDNTGERRKEDFYMDKDWKRIIKLVEYNYDESTNSFVKIEVGTANELNTFYLSESSEGRPAELMDICLEKPFQYAPTCGFREPLENGKYIIEREYYDY